MPAEKGLDKQGVWSGSFLLAIPTSILWILLNRKKKSVQSFRAFTILFDDILCNSLEKLQGWLFKASVVIFLKSEGVYKFKAGKPYECQNQCGGENEKTK